MPSVFLSHPRTQLAQYDGPRATAALQAIARCAIDIRNIDLPAANQRGILVTQASQMPTAALALHPRVVATPHIGGLTPPDIEHQAMETVAQVAEILQGRVPEGAVNAEQTWRWRAGHRTGQSE